MWQKVKKNSEKERSGRDRLYAAKWPGIGLLAPALWGPEALFFKKVIYSMICLRGVQVTCYDKNENIQRWVVRVLRRCCSPRLGGTTCVDHCKNPLPPARRHTVSYGQTGHARCARHNMIKMKFILPKDSSTKVRIFDNFLYWYSLLGFKSF